MLKRDGKTVRTLYIGRNDGGKVVGIDFGSHSVKLCESAATLERSNMGCDLEQLEIDAHQRPSFEQLAERLKGYWSSEVSPKKQFIVPHRHIWLPL